jgi:hypothetical protein
MNRDIQISNEIITIDVSADKTIQQLADEFFAIMEKYDIRLGVRDKNGGITLSNPEWTLYLTLFISRVDQLMNMGIAFGWGGFNIPKTIEAYSKKENKQRMKQ